MSEKLPIESWPIEKLVPYAKNAKKHPDEQIEKLAKSIKTFGWTQPIVVDRNGVIIIGHGRRLAALKLNLKKVPVVVRTDLTDQQVKALRLADNRVTSTDYDTNQLQIDLSELDLDGFDLSVTGFDEKELSFLIDSVGEMNEDAFVANMPAALEAQKESHAKAMEEADNRPVPLHQAFGFKTIPGSAESIIARFMAQIEVNSGHTGAEALVCFIKEYNENG